VVNLSGAGGELRFQTVDPGLHLDDHGVGAQGDVG